MLNFRTYGQPPHRAAVIHGGPGAPGSVGAVARELAGDMGVLEPLQTATSLVGQVAELRSVLQEHVAAPACLIGHSWGAWLAYLLAADSPSLVSRLVLVGSGPFTPEYASQINANRFRRLTADEQALYQELLAQLGTPGVADSDRLLARLGALVEKADSYDPLTIPTDAADHLTVDGAQYQNVWAEAAAMRKSGELLALAGRISCPVFAIHGDTDPHPAEGVREPLAERLSDFRFRLLERCGHTPWKERQAQAQFYALLRAELASER